MPFDHMVLLLTLLDHIYYVFNALLALFANILFRIFESLFTSEIALQFFFLVYFLGPRLS